MTDKLDIRNSLACATDTIIAAVLVYHLVRCPSLYALIRPKPPVPHHLRGNGALGMLMPINYLTRWHNVCFFFAYLRNFSSPLTLNAVALHTGVLTAGWAIASLILFVRFRFAIVTLMTLMIIPNRRCQQYVQYAIFMTRPLE